MTTFTAVIIDETGCEFPGQVTARSRFAAHRKLQEMYPEARRIEQVESPADRRIREARLERQVQREYDDPHGYHYGED